MSWSSVSFFDAIHKVCLLVKTCPEFVTLTFHSVVPRAFTFHNSAFIFILAADSLFNFFFDQRFSSLEQSGAFIYLFYFQEFF